METREEFGMNMAQKCMGSILMAEDIVEGREKITNYSDDKRKLIGNQFATVAAIANLCSALVQEENAVPSTVDMYDSFTNVFVRNAFIALMSSGAHESPDEITEWCNTVGKGISEKFYYHEVDPIGIFDAAMETVEDIKRDERKQKAVGS
jgi:hypothetical protein